MRPDNKRIFQRYLFIYFFNIKENSQKKKIIDAVLNEVTRTKHLQTNSTTPHLAQKDVVKYGDEARFLSTARSLLFCSRQFLKHRRRVSRGGSWLQRRYENSLQHPSNQGRRGGKKRMNGLPDVTKKPNPTNFSRKHR